MLKFLFLYDIFKKNFTCCTVQNYIAGRSLSNHLDKYCYESKLSRCLHDRTWNVVFAGSMYFFLKTLIKRKNYAIFNGIKLTVNNSRKLGV